ncbi:MAG: SCP2 sterol-binding domain-containing protein [Pseudomonadota bacterium]
MLPHPLLLPLRLIPDAVHTELFARVFNHLLRGQPLAARLPEIDGKSVCLHIRDAASELHFRIEQGRLRPAAPGRADVRISGNVEDFWQLATRSEDPDTLFFSRRLCIEGDTATGLHVKNLLDALDYDWESHFRDVLGAGLGAVAFAVIQRVISQRLAAR